MEGGLDAWVNALVAPAAQALSDIIFFKVGVGDARLPLVVLWLIAGGLWFTLSFRFVNLRGFARALRIVSGRDPRAKGGDGTAGEVTHFQALATAISGTVGIGNIGGVAVAISMGGPGAALWMVLAGFLGMSSKFVECTLGVIYRHERDDGQTSGGPMYYLERGLGELGWKKLGRAMGVFYAAGIVIGCLGIGNMFQSNQAFVQFVEVTGGPSASWFADKGWLFGVTMAFLVGLVIVGGIRSIARVTGKIVPFMGLLYLVSCGIVLSLNAEALPFALDAIWTGAFSPEGVSGGALGVMILGFQRAVFSNEAGLGSATIAHAAVRTDHAATEGLVAILEPFVDTVVICSATALVITTTLYWQPDLFASGLGGVEMTSAAFDRALPGSPMLVAVAALLFAFSTMLSWSYYGLKGWTYLVGHGPRASLGFNLAFCVFVALGCMVQLQAILDFSDAMVFVLCVPNLLGMMILAPAVRRELARYTAPHADDGAAGGLDR